MLWNELVALMISRTGLINFSALSYYMLFEPLASKYWTQNAILALAAYAIANFLILWLGTELLVTRIPGLGWSLLALYAVSLIPIINYSKIHI